MSYITTVVSIRKDKEMVNGGMLISYKVRAIFNVFVTRIRETKRARGGNNGLRKKDSAVNAEWPVSVLTK